MGVTIRTAEVVGFSSRAAAPGKGRWQRTPEPSRFDTIDSACEPPRDGRPGYEAWLLKFLRPRLIRLVCIRTPDVLDVDRDPDSADLDVLRAPRLENRLLSVWPV
jgi:hypothetical protein